MKALLCTCTPVTPRLGASKVFLEAARSYRELGWECSVVGPDEIAAPGAPGDIYRELPLKLRDYLRRHAGEFDVVEYEPHQLPFPRATFSARPLLVARSVLLIHLQVRAGYLARPTLLGKLGKLLKQRRWRARMQAVVAQADVTLRAADVINVCNAHEREILLEAGHPAEKILLEPFGLFPERFSALEPAPSARLEPRVAFVGTFDPRKGMAEFPTLVRTVLAAHPNARFRLVGTASLVRDQAGVLAYFPRAVRERLEVVPSFAPERLPSLLADCAVGVFPSHCEGFPFAVLEQLAAGLPVFAYDVPGPPMLLPAEYLVRRGDGAELGRRVSALLASPEKLHAAQQWARGRAADFPWETSARETLAFYAARLAAR